MCISDKGVGRLYTLVVIIHCENRTSSVSGMDLFRWECCQIVLRAYIPYDCCEIIFIVFPGFKGKSRNTQL